MIIETKNKIELKNTKGAIIIGKNASGKSKIIDRIKTQSGWKKHKAGEIIIDGIKTKVIHFSIDTINDDSYKGTTSVHLKRIDQLTSSIKKNIKPPTSLTSGADYNNFKKNLEDKVKMNNIEDIFETGIDIKYSANINDISFDLDISFEFEGDTYKLNDLSLGMKSIIGTIYMGVMNGMSDHLLLIDEIDAFLHPAWIRIISTLIHNLWKKNKIILVTHNPLMLSLLAKEHHEMISFVEKGEAIDGGKIITLDWVNIERDIKKELEQKPTFWNESKQELSESFIKKYIQININTETAAIFFNDKPVIVEGYSEKIYFEHKLNKATIQAGGFYQFPILFFILKNMLSSPKFIMDNDKKWYNKHVKNLIADHNENWVHMVNKDFDHITSGRKLKSWEKTPKSIWAIVNGPKDPEKELDTIIEFIKTK